MMRISPISDSTNNQALAARKLPKEFGLNNQDLKLTYDNQNTDQISKQKKINNAVEVANELMNVVDIGFKYHEDKATRIDIIEVIDNKTGEKLKQIPAEEIVQMVTKMYEMWGIFVDQKV